MIPVLGKLKLFLTDKELIIPQGSLYIINSQEIHGMHHTEDTDIYKGYALQINYDFIKKYCSSNRSKSIYNYNRYIRSTRQGFYKYINIVIHLIH